MKADRDRRHAASTAALALGTLGIVYGDIGTSPLYALRESFHHARAAVNQTTTYRRGVRRVLGPGHHHLGQVPAARDAGRQPRGGRHPRPDRAADAAAPTPATGVRGASWRSACSAPRSSTATGSSRPPSPCSARWRDRRWRRPPGDLGGAGGGRHPRRALLGAAAGHRRDRAGLRPRDGRVVRRDRPARPAQVLGHPGCWAVNPGLRRRLLRRHGPRFLSLGSSSSSSPAARPSTPTWATSAAARSG